MASLVDRADAYLIKYAQVEFDINFIENRLRAPYISLGRLQKLTARIQKNLHIVAQLEGSRFSKVRDEIQLLAMSSSASKFTERLLDFSRKEVNTSQLRSQLQGLQAALNEKYLASSS
jgi:hypothetical protein